MSRLVTLEYPRALTKLAERGMPNYGDTDLPLLRSRPLIRTAQMGRWHRPRSGWVHRFSRGGFYANYDLWCHYRISAYANGATRPNGHNPVRFADTVPSAELLCGTCEGRAVGAGQEPVGIECLVELIYEPERDDLRTAS